MKNKLNDIGMIKQSLGWLAVFAGAGLAVGALNYREFDQKIELGERNAELAQSMVQVAHVNALLRQIGEGQADEAKKELSSELAYELTVVKSLSATAEPWNKEFATQVVKQIEQTERKHPDYYVAAALGPISSGEVAQVARH